MKFKKRILSETLLMEEKGTKPTFSEKPQSIVITESQLERLIERISEEK